MFARLICTALLFCCFSSSLACAEAPPLERERLDAMLEAGDEGMIMSLFKRHPGAVLPFFDELLEEGLAEIEKTEQAGAPVDRPEEALWRFRRAIRYAELADKAFGDQKTFTLYANSFASWNAAERKRFREGQRLYREGRTLAKSDPAAAIPILEASRRLAQPLGDEWGVAMASRALAEACFALGDDESMSRAWLEIHRAITLYQRLKLQRDELASQRLNALQRHRFDTEHPSRLHPSQVSQPFEKAWQLVSESGGFDVETVAAVGEEYAVFREAKGDLEAAAQIRAEVARRKEEAAKEVGTGD